MENAFVMIMLLLGISLLIQIKILNHVSLSKNIIISICGGIFCIIGTVIVYMIAEATDPPVGMAFAGMGRVMMSMLIFAIKIIFLNNALLFYLNSMHEKNFYFDRMKHKPLKVISDVYINFN